MHVDHLNGSEFFENRTGAQAGSQIAQATTQGDLKAIRHEGNKDVGLNAVFALMVNGAQGQVSLKILEYLLHLGELDVDLPEPGWRFLAEIKLSINISLLIIP
jgi:hypothetical protein